MSEKEKKKGLTQRVYFAVQRFSFAIGKTAEVLQSHEGFFLVFSVCSVFDEISGIRGCRVLILLCI